MFHFCWSSLFREIYQTFFSAALKDRNLQKSKKLPLQTLLWSCLNFVSQWVYCTVKGLEDCTEGNWRKWHKNGKKPICLGIYRLYNSRFNAKILPELKVCKSIYLCLLRVVSLRGVDVITNAKTVSTSSQNAINLHPIEGTNCPF